MMRVGALDCGTNTLRLLVAGVDRSHSVLASLVRRSEVVRLGERVDESGEFAAPALERTFAVLDEYCAVLEEHGVSVEARRMVATSAARDVSNREAFLAGARKRVGVVPEIVSGEDEAFLMYDGATHGLGSRDDIPEPVLALDIGGGSTELVMADQRTGRLRAISLDVGSVRLTERHLHHDPPSPAEIEAATRDVATALATVELPHRQARCVIGVAGTVMTVGAMVLGLTSYDKERLHLVRLHRAQVEDTVERLLMMTVAQRQALPFMAPGRADIVGAGGIVLREVLRRYQVPELLPSVHDILDGIAWSIVAGRG
jgi:exopolyphosphatase/guanosine-5'-triphosphate,3'-diphosphate pyrophosphatase